MSATNTEYSVGFLMDIMGYSWDEAGDTERVKELEDYICPAVMYAAEVYPYSTLARPDGFKFPDGVTLRHIYNEDEVRAGYRPFTQIEYPDGMDEDRVFRAIEKAVSDFLSKHGWTVTKADRWLKFTRPGHPAFFSDEGLADALEATIGGAA